MLVIVSDLHLKDGTAGASITADAFRVFAERLRSLAYRASWRSDGCYRPVETIDLVLLGDIFDHILSARWLEQAEGQPGYVRPWHDPHSPAFIAKIQAINRGTLTHNAEAFGVFKLLNEGQAIMLPPATSVGRPDSHAAHLPVRVNTHLVIGNHDWFLHLPGPDYDEMRREVIESLGLANSIAPFPHDPTESPALLRALQAHGVLARHGDIHDKMNFDEEIGRDAASLGDALAVEMLTRFPLEVHRQLGHDLPLQFSEGLKELTNIRPVLVTPLWISNLVRNFAGSPQVGDAVKQIWDDLGEQFLDLEFVRAHDKRFAFDMVDALQAILRISNALPFDTINLAMAALADHMGQDKVSFAKHALAEPAFKDRSARFVVYGHTHFHEIRPMDVTVIADTLFEQLYINSGTWHSYHDLTMAHPENQRFIGMHVMTYLVFFKDGERDGRPFESWSGSLGAHDRHLT